MGKTITRTNLKQKGEIAKIQKLAAKMTHSAPKKGYKEQRAKQKTKYNSLFPAHQSETGELGTKNYDDNPVRIA